MYLWLMTLHQSIGIQHGSTNIRTNSALFMHQEWVLDMSQYYIASSINLNQIGTLGFALNYFDYGRERGNYIRCPRWY